MGQGKRSQESEREEGSVMVRAVVGAPAATVEVPVVIAASRGLAGLGLLRQMGPSGGLIQSSMPVLPESRIHVRFVLGDGAPPAAMDDLFPRCKDDPETVETYVYPHPVGYG